MNQKNKLDKRNIEDVLQLTPVQAGLLFHYLKDPGTELYVEQLSLRLVGNITTGVFKDAWNRVTAANQMLRTVFRWERMDNPVQLVLKHHDCITVELDLTGEPLERKEKRLEELKRGDRRKGFDLEEVAFRVTLCKLTDAGMDSQYEMIIGSHHILYDGWSNGIILKEFFHAYDELAAGLQPESKRKVSFKEFIKWDQSRDKGPEQAYWRDYLGAFPGKNQLPVKQPVVGGADEVGTMVSRTIDLSWLQPQLEALVQTERVTAAAVLYTAWGLVLHKYTAADDVVFGTTVSGRSAQVPGIRDMVGLFINTPPLRMGVEKDALVTDLIGRVNGALLDREAFQNSGLTDIRRYAGISADEDVFDTIVVIENYPLKQLFNRRASGDGRFRVEGYRMQESTHYDLTVNITLFEGIEVAFAYNDALFSGETIQRMQGHFKQLLTMIMQPGLRTADLDMLTREEKERLLVTFNASETPYPSNKTLHEFLQFHAQKTPDHRAVTVLSAQRSAHDSPSSPDFPEAPAVAQLTYGELDALTSALADHLSAWGAVPGGIIGLMTERSLAMPLGIYGILKTGNAYLPIDPGYPAERVGYILADSGARILLTRGDCVAGAPDGVTVIDLDAFIENNPLKELSPASGESRGRAVDTAYVIYTSGSTGNPKGVMVEHHSAVNRIKWMQSRYPLDAADVILQKTPYTFDVSVWEQFWWAMEGAGVCFLQPGGEKDPAVMAEAVEANGVTVMHFVPSMMQAMLEYIDTDAQAVCKQLASLKYVFASGEQLGTAQTRRFNRYLFDSHGTKLINLYGPTEASIDVTYFDCFDTEIPGLIPIGKTIDNIKLYVIGDDGRITPIGIPGELCIHGVGLARGYLNRQELTAEKFITVDPRFFSTGVLGKPLSQFPPAVCGDVSYPEPVPGACAVDSPHMPNCLYRTGDTAAYMEDGNILFLGRRDGQVKIRGLRIELGEIESRLCAYPGIGEAVVLVKSRDDGDKYLCAFFVPADTDNLNDVQKDNNVETGGVAVPGGVAALRRHLGETLPDYMVPAFFQPLTAMPLTAHGKADRKALAAMAMDEIPTETGYQAPIDEIEARLADIWSKLLDIPADRIGRDHHFFQLGGHSLKATTMVSRIHKYLEVKINIGDVFTYPVLGDLAAHIKAVGRVVFHTIDAVPAAPSHPLAPAQLSLFILNELGNVGTAYNLPAVWIVAGPLDRERFRGVFEQLIQRHENLRTAFKYIDGAAAQVVLEPQEIRFDVEYNECPISGDPLSEANRSRLEPLIDDFARVFDLAQPPLFRVGLTRLADDVYLMQFDMHHIISDGVTAVIMAREFSRLYDGDALPPLRIQYKDFAAWQIKHVKSPEMKRQELYWLQQFDNGVPRLDMPTDLPRPHIQDFGGASVSFHIPAPLTQTIRTLIAQTDVTLYVVLLAAYNILLARYSGKEDILVGLPIAGRNHADLENIVGFFVNTLVMRNQPRGTLTVAEFLENVKHTALQGYENQNYPFEQLVNKLDIPKDLSRTPIFDVTFVLQNMDPLEEPRELRMTPYHFERHISHFDLHLQAFERKETIDMALEYATALFNRETVKGITQHYVEILEQMTGDMELKLKDISIKHNLKVAKSGGFREEAGGFDF